MCNNISTPGTTFTNPFVLLSEVAQVCGVLYIGIRTEHQFTLGFLLNLRRFTQRVTPRTLIIIGSVGFCRITSVDVEEG